MAAPSAPSFRINGSRSWLPIAALSGIVLCALAWYAGLVDTSQSRLFDFARLGELQHSRSVVAALAGSWSAFCAATWRMRLAEVAVQAAAVVVAAATVRARTRSDAAALVAAALLALSPLPEFWLGRPLGILDALAVFGLAAAFSPVSGDLRAARWGAAGALLATLAAGWPLVAVLALAVLRRDRTALMMAGAGALGLAARAFAGVPLAEAAGTWSAGGPYALSTLRFVVKAAFAVPAVVFAATRPAARSVVRGARETLRGSGALAAAACGAALAAPFLPDGAAALFAAAIAAVVFVATLLVTRPGAGVRAVAGAVALAVVLLGVGLRVQHPRPDDAQSVAHDREVVAAAAAADSNLTVIDHGDAAVRAHYPPFVLAYLAGRPVDVHYTAKAPRDGFGLVLDARRGGITRVDEALRAVRALAAARRGVRYDILAHAGQGRINSDAHEDTPSGHGVIAPLHLPGPDGIIPSLTVLSPYTYVFERLPVGPGERLVFVEAKALPAGSAMRATIRIEIPGRAPLVVTDDLPPADPSGTMFWRFRSVALGATGHVWARVTFSASTPSGNNVGDWASFGAPAIVAP